MQEKADVAIRNDKPISSRVRSLLGLASARARNAAAASGNVVFSFIHRICMHPSSPPSPPRPSPAADFCLVRPRTKCKSSEARLFHRPARRPPSSDFSRITYPRLKLTQFNTLGISRVACLQWFPESRIAVTFFQMRAGGRHFLMEKRYEYCIISMLRTRYDALGEAFVRMSRMSLINQ